MGAYNYLFYLRFEFLYTSVHESDKWEILNIFAGKMKCV